MKKAKSNRGFDYKEVILAEDRRFKGKDYKARQDEVVANLEKEYGIPLSKNNKGGGVKKMVVKGGVKQAVKVKKTAKVPPKVDMVKQEQKAISLLNELKSCLNCNGVKLEFSSHTKSGYCSYKAGRKMVFAIRYNSHGSISPVFPITEKEYKELGAKGKFGDWWTAEYGFKNGDDIKSFAKFAEVSIEKVRKLVDKPRPKVFADSKKAKAKKAVKPIVKTI